MTRAAVTEPAYDRAPYVHEDGRECHWRRYFVGNMRDGHWNSAYWYWGDGWRFCARVHV